jgi:hypothetical protein
MRLSERKRRITGTGSKGKTAVMGILERDGNIRTSVVPSRRKKVLQDECASMLLLARRSIPMLCSPTKDSTDYNNRKDMIDSGRFKLAMSQVFGKRLT